MSHKFKYSDLNHVCTLANKKVVNKKDAFFIYARISKHNPRTKYYFRSQESIERERQRVKSLKAQHIIHPFSVLRFYWELFVCFCYYVNLYYLPIAAVIRTIYIDDFSYNIIIADYVFDSVNIVDCISSFVTGKFSKSTATVIIEPKAIAKNLFTSVKFYINVICCIPTSLFISLVEIFFLTARESKYGIIFYMFDFVKILRMIPYCSYFSNAAALIRHHAHMLHFLVTLLTLSLFVHWLTCIALIATLLDGTGFSENYEEINSIYSDNFYYALDNEYIQRLFLVISYILNVDVNNGQGTLLKPDKVIFIIYSILGYIGYQYLFVAMLQLFKNTSKLKFFSIKSQLLKYLEYKELPKGIKDRILCYYEYRFRGKFFRENKILDTLSETLRRDINLYSYRTLIETVSLFKDGPPEVIANVVAVLKREVFLYNDYIIKAGVRGDCMYFIANGTVAVSTPTGKEICHLQDGAFFGEIALVNPDQKRVANVLAIEICEIFRLDRKNFVACFPKESSFYQKIERVAFERLQKTQLLEELHKKYLFFNPA